MPEDVRIKVSAAAKERGFKTSAAFIRAAIQDAIDRLESKKALDAIEQRIAKSMDRLHGEQQACIAMGSALAKLIVRLDGGANGYHRDLLDEFSRDAAAEFNTVKAGR